MNAREHLYRGSCHCGRIAFECDGQLERVSICSCAICGKQGFMHWLVPRARFRLLTPRAHPGSVDDNVRCLEGVDFRTVSIDYSDRRLLQASHAGGARRSLDA